MPRRAKRRLPTRVRQPLEVPAAPDPMWAMDFMHDTLFCGKRFRTFNLIDEGVREALAIEVDRSLPEHIRIDNGPELQSAKLVS